jgi:hypothetical protein
MGQHVTFISNSTAIPGCRARPAEVSTAAAADDARAETPAFFRRELGA